MGTFKFHLNAENSLILKLLVSPLGMILANIRLGEPYVWQSLKQTCCGKNHIEKRVKFSEESLNSFLNSALNIEHVYIILTGINKHLENRNSNKLSTVKRIIFESYIVKDVKNWSIGASELNLETSIIKNMSTNQNNTSI